MLTPRADAEACVDFMTPGRGNIEQAGFTVTARRSRTLEGADCARLARFHRRSSTVSPPVRLLDEPPLAGPSWVATVDIGEHGTMGRGAVLTAWRRRR